MKLYKFLIAGKELKISQVIEIVKGALIRYIKLMGENSFVVCSVPSHLDLLFQKVLFYDYPSSCTEFMVPLDVQAYLS